MPFPQPEEMHASFAEAMRTRDVDALLDLYEPEATVLLPDGAELTSTDARREMFAGLIAAGGAPQGTQRTVVVAGDLALTSSIYQLDSDPADGRPTSVVTAEVSRRQADGSWRVVIDAPAFSS